MNILDFRPRLGRAMLLAVVTLTGCYSSFEGDADGGPPVVLPDGEVVPGPDLGPPAIRCGPGFCSPGERCCPECRGGETCQPEGVSCPDLDCEEGDCGTNADCAAGEYCALALGACVAPPEGGVCAPRPARCGGDCPGVCGCDGVTYCNACEAAAAGTNVVVDQPCTALCGPDAELCPPGRYCELGTLCGEAGNAGSCELRPTRCGDEGPEACGCDGSRYRNACEANRAGVSVAVEERCTEPPPTPEEVCATLCDDWAPRCGDVFPVPADQCPLLCGLLITTCDEDELRQAEGCFAIDDCTDSGICLFSIACVMMF
ncbi:MAG: hypothetical protein ACFCGT_00370 [Sandaracinaceae bacterium]